MPTNTYPHPYAAYPLSLDKWDDGPHPGDPVTVEGIVKIARKEIAAVLAEHPQDAGVVKRIEALTQALELLGKQVEEHNKFLLTLQARSPDPRDPRWQCYCGWSGAASVCGVCGRRGAP